MADWPEVDELKQRLDITSDDWDDTMERHMAAAIEQVQKDVGEPVDEPDESLADAALTLAVYLGSTDGEADIESARRLPKYQRLLKGHRVRFGIA